MGEGCHKASGDPGPVCFCVPDIYLPKTWVAQFNKKWASQYAILHSGTDSHFMTANTTIDMYEAV